MPQSTPLDRELASLRSLIMEMAGRLDEQLADATNALLNGNTNLAAEVIARDDAIDEIEMQIDEQCERILALHAPVAVDLRMLIMTVKINTDFERIGDHCRNLSHDTEHLAAHTDLIADTHIPEMADMARCMLREVEVAFLEQDRLKARKVVARDLQVNRMHANNFSLFVNMARENGERAEAMAHLLSASKGLERISDHAKNVAKSVVFMIEGNDIRHRRLRTGSE
jgi:phosphate transport system protein